MIFKGDFIAIGNEIRFDIQILAANIWEIFPLSFEIPITLSKSMIMASKIDLCSLLNHNLGDYLISSISVCNLLEARKTKRIWVRTRDPATRRTKKIE